MTPKVIQTITFPHVQNSDPGRSPSAATDLMLSSHKYPQSGGAAACCIHVFRTGGSLNSPTHQHPIIYPTSTRNGNIPPLATL